MNETILSLSTCHMPSTNPNFGDIRHIAIDEGYIVWPCESSNCPDWIKPIIGLAKKTQSVLVLFDCDAKKSDEFKSWEW